MKNSFTKFIIKNQSWSIPALLALVVYIPLLIWLKLDNSLPHWDMGRHLFNSVQYSELWSDFIAGRGSFGQLASGYFYFPPFFYQVAAFFYLLFGISQKVAVASNLVWIFILVYSVYHLVRQLWDRKTAVLSLAVLFSMPIIIGSLRQYQLDLPLTAWVSLTYLMLYQFQKKPQTSKAVWIGLIIGLGMLLQWTFVVFALPMVVWVITVAIKEKKIASKKLAISLAVSLLVALAVMAFWYLSNLSAICADFMANGIVAAQKEGDPTGITFPAISYYLKALNEYYLLLPLAIIFLFGAVSSFVRRAAIRRNAFSIFMIIFIYIVFSILPNKDLRCIMPMAPFLAIIIASVVNRISSKERQAGLVAFLMLVFMINNITVAFNASGGKDLMLGPLYLLRGNGHTSAAPRQEFCPIENIVQSIPLGASARLVGSNPIEFNNQALSYYLEKAGRSWAGEGMDVSQSDYWILRLDTTSESRETLFQFQDTARIVENYPCSDRSLVIVMKNATRAETYLPKY